MKSIYSVMAALAFAWPVAASAAVGDPELIIYRLTGVNTNGAATNFHCTPFSGAPETVRFVTREGNGNLVANASGAVGHLATASFTAPSSTVGTAAIAATSNQVVCAAFVGSSILHMIRFNPISGTEE